MIPHGRACMDEPLRLLLRDSCCEALMPALQEQPLPPAPAFLFAQLHRSSGLGQTCITNPPLNPSLHHHSIHTAHFTQLRADN